jgi:outer membrane biosynthesis protein TonB
VIDRSEAGGIALSIAAHVALFAALSLGFVAAARPLVVKSTPIEVSLTDETALVSSAPVPSMEPPASGAPPAVQPEPQPEQPVAAPAEQPSPAKPKPKPSLTLNPDSFRPDPTPPTPSQQPRRNPVQGSAGSANGKGPAKEPNTNTSANATGQVPGPVRAALLNQIRLMLKPNWQAPTGSDIDKLKTWVRIQLNPDGTLKSVTFDHQEGQTDLNRAQWELHKERAIAAVRKTHWDTNILKPETYAVWGDFKTYFGKWQ